LNELTLDCPNISGIGIRKLTQLRHLELWGPSIDNKSLSYICNLSNLSFLGLHHTKIDDNGAIYIEKMENLNYLDIQNSTISEYAIKELRGALPNLYN
jgi:Leucine-rich repeat (LRR) protein